MPVPKFSRIYKMPRSKASRIWASHQCWTKNLGWKSKKPGSSTWFCPKARPYLSIMGYSFLMLEPFLTHLICLTVLSPKKNSLFSRDENQRFTILRFSLHSSVTLPLWMPPLFAKLKISTQFFPVCSSHSNKFRYLSSIISYLINITLEKYIIFHNSSNSLITLLKYQAFFSDHI